MVGNLSLRQTPFSRRRVLIGGLGVGAAAALAACGSGGSGGSGGETSALSFWSRDTQGNGAMEQPLRDRLSAFDKANGTTTQVVFMNLQDSSQKELAALTAGGLPTLGEQGQDVSMQFAEGGHLTPLDDLYNKVKGNYIKLPKAAVTQLDGKTYALPWWLETRVLWYHKDLLEQAGVKPPTTWAEWLEVGKATTKGSSQYGFVLSSQGAGIGQLFTPLAAGAGGTMLDTQGKLDTTPDPFIKALDFINQLYTTAMPPATPTYDAATVEQLFVAKKTAMLWDNGAILATIAQTKPDLLDNVGCVVTPPMNAGGVSRSFLGGFELFAFSKGAGADHGPAMIEYLLGDASFYASFVKASGGTALPVLSESAASADFKSGVRKTMIDQLATACRYGGPAYGTHGYMGQAESNNVFSDPVTTVWSKKATPAQAVSTMFDKLKQLEAGS